MRQFQFCVVVFNDVQLSRNKIIKSIYFHYNELLLLKKCVRDAEKDKKNNG